MDIIISENSVCHKCDSFHSVESNIDGEKEIYSICLLNNDVFYDVCSRSDKMISELSIESCNQKDSSKIVNKIAD